MQIHLHPSRSASFLYNVSDKLSLRIQRIQPNLATPDRISRPPSHVLVHDADASNVWIPLPVRQQDVTLSMLTS